MKLVEGTTIPGDRKFSKGSAKSAYSEYLKRSEEFPNLIHRLQISNDLQSVQIVSKSLDNYFEILENEKASSFESWALGILPGWK